MYLVDMRLNSLFLRTHDHSHTGLELNMIHARILVWNMKIF